MQNDLARQLRRQRQAIARQTASRLAEDPSSPVDAGVDRIEAIDKLLAAMPSSLLRRLLIPGGTALACSLLVWLAWTVRVDSFGIKTWVAIEATADRVALELDAPWELLDPLPLAGRSLRIDQATLAFNDPALLFGALPGRSRVDISPAASPRQLSLGLARLSLEAATEPQTESADNGRVSGPAKLTIERPDPRQVRLLLSGDVAGEVDIGGKAAIAWREPSGTRREERLDLELPEILAFTSEGDSAVPVLVEASLPWGNDLVFHHLTVANVRFGQEVQLLPGEWTELSTIHSGTLRLPELEQSVPLDPGVGLQLEGFDGYVREVAISPKSAVITIAYQGEADRITLLSPGSHGLLEQGLERDLTPSLLTYAYQNQRLELVFAAVAFLWGAFFYLRGLLLGSK